MSYIVGPLDAPTGGGPQGQEPSSVERPRYDPNLVAVDVPDPAQGAPITWDATTLTEAVALNETTGATATDAAAASALSSVPDTQKKYKASSRAADFEKEAATTQQLNQQVASAGGIAK